NDTEGLVDVMAALSDEDHQKWQQDIKSIQIALAKAQLHKLSFKIIHSSTILLPQWKEILDEDKLKQKILPQDISTCQNSTFDIITAFLEYKPAVKKTTTEQENDL
ncbi:hypothetical protein ARMGADRAFT_860374, partial [Armillaria gallica]